MRAPDTSGSPDTPTEAGPGASLHRRPRGLLVTFSLLFIIGVIAAIDFATGMVVVISALYFIPIIAAGWLLRPGRAMAVAAMAALACVGVDLAWRASSDRRAVRLWNTAATVVSLGAVAWLVQRARKEHQALLAANRQLDLALARESETARTDALTGLPNARALSEELNRELARSRRSGTPLSLLYVDLDDFKEVNDRYGHDAGDDLLRRIGLALGAIVRQGDIAARIGGDEFVVLLVNLPFEAAKEIGARIITRVNSEAKTYAGAGVGASVGVAHFTRSFPTGAGEMLSRADALMYEAKESGKGRVVADVS